MVSGSMPFGRGRGMVSFFRISDPAALVGRGSSPRLVALQPSARVGQCLETPVRLTTDVNDPSSAGRSTGCGQSRPRAGHPPTAQEGIVHKLSIL